MTNSDNHLQHVAIICDGNRRWAKAHGMEVFMGHRKAAEEVFEDLIVEATKLGIKHLTFWVFSTENWKRDTIEVSYLMNLFKEFFDKRIDDLDKKGVRVKVIGNLEKFDEGIRTRIANGTAQTANNDRITVTLAMNYGGRDELVRGIKKIADLVKIGDINVDDISAELISRNLDTNYMPDPDLIIRTGGEQRLSGFFPWQSEYAEFAFPEFAFPDFTSEKLRKIVEDFMNRNRRFGG